MQNSLYAWIFLSLYFIYLVYLTMLQLHNDLLAKWGSLLDYVIYLPVHAPILALRFLRCQWSVSCRILLNLWTTKHSGTRKPSTFYKYHFTESGDVTYQHTFIEINLSCGLGCWQLRIGHCQYPDAISWVLYNKCLRLICLSDQTKWFKTYDWMTDSMPTILGRKPPRYQD